MMGAQGQTVPAPGGIALGPFGGFSSNPISQVSQS